MMYCKIKYPMEVYSMSDLSNCGCGCDNNVNGCGCGRGDCGCGCGFGNNSCLWIILLLICCGGCGNGFGHGGDCGCGCGNDNCLWIILPAYLLWWMRQWFWLLLNFHPFCRSIHLTLCGDIFSYPRHIHSKTLFSGSVLWKNDRSFR